MTRAVPLPSSPRGASGVPSAAQWQAGGMLGRAEPVIRRTIGSRRMLRSRTDGQGKKNYETSPAPSCEGAGPSESTALPPVGETGRPQYMSPVCALIQQRGVELVEVAVFYDVTRPTGFAPTSSN